MKRFGKPVHYSSKWKASPKAVPTQFTDANLETHDWYPIKVPVSSGETAPAPLSFFPGGICTNQRISKEFKASQCARPDPSRQPSALAVVTFSQNTRQNLHSWKTGPGAQRRC